MSTTVTLAEAEARLRELVGGLAPGDELVITDNEKPVAKLVVPPAEKPRRILGTMRGERAVLGARFRRTVRRAGDVSPLCAPTGDSRPPLANE
jgi:antitoxin (DNA-binding transcriptional repressor) of toxin-antitoxin stability system